MDGLFTTAAVNNIDYSPSSETAKVSFDGTGISFMQHPSHLFAGLDHGVVINQTHVSRSSATQEFTIPAGHGPVKPHTCKLLHELER